jgi:hypothetical protein
MGHAKGLAVIVKGQRVFLRGVPAVVLDAADGQVVVELDSGLVELVPEDLVVQAENAESVERRQGWMMDSRFYQNRGSGK